MTWHSLTSQGMLGFVLNALNWVKDKEERLILREGFLGFFWVRGKFGEESERGAGNSNGNKCGFFYYFDRVVWVV